jgi:hypothetical protein
MSHFAQLNENNEVLQVILIDNSVIGEPELSFPETEGSGVSFINNTLGILGIWKQTSYNNKFRKQYAGIGYKYDEENDVFIAPRPFASWELDENFDWQAPISKPDGDYVWNEEEGAWEEI